MFTLVLVLLSAPGVAPRYTSSVSFPRGKIIVPVSLVQLVVVVLSSCRSEDLFSLGLCTWSPLRPGVVRSVLAAWRRSAVIVSFASVLLMGPIFVFLV